MSTRNHNDSIMSERKNNKIAQSYDSNKEFGLKDYKLSKNASYNDKQGRSVLNWNNQREQEAYPKGKKTFLDDVINRAKKNMSQTNFMKYEDWNKNNTSVTLNGHIRKNEFLKCKRMTFNDVIERNAKINKVPGIGEYQNFPTDRI